MTTDELDSALIKLSRAVSAGRSKGYCLSLWSKFIRLRDGHRCVLCGGQSRLSAHHIVRKSYLPLARFAPGNGITLCLICHAEPHEVFNGLPDMGLPMDAQGGEQIDFLMGLFIELADDAAERGFSESEYYRLGEDVIAEFRRLQDLPASVDFPGSDVERAYWIWRQTPRAMLFAIAEANGLPLPLELAQRPGVVAVGDAVFLTELPARQLRLR